VDVAGEEDHAAHVPDAACRPRARRTSGARGADVSSRWEIVVDSPPGSRARRRGQVPRGAHRHRLGPRCARASAWRAVAPCSARTATRAPPPGGSPGAPATGTLPAPVRRTVVSRPLISRPPIAAPRPAADLGHDGGVTVVGGGLDDRTPVALRVELLKMPSRRTRLSAPSCMARAASAGVAMPPAQNRGTGSVPVRAISCTSPSGAWRRLAHSNCSARRRW
jgi:hypothetical protein